MEHWTIYGESFDVTVWPSYDRCSGYEKDVIYPFIIIPFTKVEVFYNIDDDDQKKSFLLSVTLPRETMNDYDVRVCLR